MPSDSPKRRAIVLLSGGLDSSTMLALALRDGYEVHAVTFGYGQRHQVEVAAAQEIAAIQGVASHRLIDIDLRAFGGSALTSDVIPVPRLNRSEASSQIPVTYVPARNTIFLAYALAAAEVADASDIFIGVNAVDYSGYPDCRPEYIAAFQEVATLATRAAVEGKTTVRIQTPLLHLSKAEIILLGRELGVNYALTVSCYDPDALGHACGECDACRLRLNGFKAAGTTDPARYSAAAIGPVAEGGEASTATRGAKNAK